MNTTQSVQKAVLAGGSGQVGQLLARHYTALGWDVVVLSRGTPNVGRHVPWDGKSLAPWAKELEGADMVINLAGRSVNCRYTAENLAEMMNSRVDSTRVVGQAIAAAKSPPPLWLQMSTATIYAHRFDTANDETSGLIGGTETDVPRYWDNSVEIAKAWEAELAAANTPHTRKVALRSSMVMSADKGGIFDVLSGLTKCGLGGSVAGGQQFVSWIHGHDFVRAVEFVREHAELDGAINVASPNPVPQRELMAALRSALGVAVGLPATAWMAEIGAIILRTDTELLLKSRRVVPKRLQDAGFQFMHPKWPEAAKLLATQRRAQSKPNAPTAATHAPRRGRLNGATGAVRNLAPPAPRHRPPPARGSASGWRETGPAESPRTALQCLRGRRRE